MESVKALLGHGSNVNIESNKVIKDGCKQTPLVVLFTHRIKDSKTCQSDGSLQAVVNLLNQSGAALTSKSGNCDYRGQLQPPGPKKSLLGATWGSFFFAPSD